MVAERSDRPPPPHADYSEAVWYILNLLRSPRAAQGPFDAVDMPSPGPHGGWLRCWWWLPWRCCVGAAGVGVW